MCSWTLQNQPRWLWQHPRGVVCVVTRGERDYLSFVAQTVSAYFTVTTVVTERKLFTQCARFTVHIPWFELCPTLSIFVKEFMDVCLAGAQGNCSGHWVRAGHDQIRCFHKPHWHTQVMPAQHNVQRERHRNREKVTERETRYTAPLITTCSICSHTLAWKLTRSCQRQDMSGNAVYNVVYEKEG